MVNDLEVFFSVLAIANQTLVITKYFYLHKQIINIAWRMFEFIDARMGVLRKTAFLICAFKINIKLVGQQKRYFNKMRLFEAKEEYLNRQRALAYLREYISIPVQWNWSKKTYKQYSNTISSDLF